MQFLWNKGTKKQYYPQIQLHFRRELNHVYLFCFTNQWFCNITAIQIGSQTNTFLHFCTKKLLSSLKKYGDFISLYKFKCVAGNKFDFHFSKLP